MYNTYNTINVFAVIIVLYHIHLSVSVFTQVEKEIRGKPNDHLVHLRKRPLNLRQHSTRQVKTDLQLDDFSTDVPKWHSSGRVFVTIGAEQSGDDDIGIELPVHRYVNLIDHVRPYDFRSKN